MKDYTKIPNEIKEKPEWFCESSDLPLEEQKWSWDNVQCETKDESNDNTNVNGNVNDNDTYKLSVNSELNQSKLQAISDLKICTYQTSPKEIASLLEKIFISYESEPGHWLYIAQHWSPRAINGVIAYMIKVNKSGRKTFKNPAAAFTSLIKLRKKRKEFRDINDACKEHE